MLTTSNNAESMCTAQGALLASYASLVAPDSSPKAFYQSDYATCSVAARGSCALYNSQLLEDLPACTPEITASNEAIASYYAAGEAACKTLQRAGTLTSLNYDWVYFDRCTCPSACSRSSCVCPSRHAISRVILRLRIPGCVQPRTTPSMCIMQMLQDQQHEYKLNLSCSKQASFARLTQLDPTAVMLCKACELASRISSSVSHLSL